MTTKTDNRIETLQAKREELELEQRQLQASLPALKAVASTPTGGAKVARQVQGWYGPETVLESPAELAYGEAVRRLHVIPAEIGDIDRALREMRTERAVELGRSWTTSTTTRELLQVLVNDWGGQLGTIAEALVGYETARLAGADGTVMPGLPQALVGQLLEFEAFVTNLRKFDIKVDVTGLPESVSRRIEATR